MSCSRFAAALVVLACALGLHAPPASAATDGATRHVKERQQSKARQAERRKAPAKPQQRAQKPQQKPVQKARQDAGPKPSTDTESRITRPGDYTFVTQHGGLARTYRVHVPARYSQATPAPLLVVMHGGGGNMDSLADDAAYGLISKSEREGFVAVFPNGYATQANPRAASWNAGTCCGLAREQNVDDVGFIGKVVMNVFGQLSVDRQRIYATGMAQGGMMAYRLACEMPEVFRAVAAVAAIDSTRSCSPRTPVSVLHIHASDDKQVPFNGAARADPSDAPRTADSPSVPGTVSKWARLNGCAAAPTRTLEMGGAYCEAYSYCRSQAEVQLCVTQSGGHSWPGGRRPAGGQPPSQAISATDAVWTFLSRH